MTWPERNTRRGCGGVPWLFVVCAVMAIAGCGGSAVKRTTTLGASESKTPPSVAIEVSIPALLAKRYIPKHFTCDGADVSLPVKWSEVPPGTVELAVFFLNPAPIKGAVFFDWAVAGLDPKFGGVSAGRLPRGAVVGRNSFGETGYSVCPARGIREEHVIVRLLALRKRVAVTQGFDAEAFYREARRYSSVVGLAGGIYRRT